MCVSVCVKVIRKERERGGEIDRKTRNRNRKIKQKQISFKSTSLIYLN